jgi:hypothetical protein
LYHKETSTRHFTEVAMLTCHDGSVSASFLVVACPHINHQFLPWFRSLPYRVFDDGFLETLVGIDDTAKTAQRNRIGQVERRQLVAESKHLLD